MISRTGNCYNFVLQRISGGDDAEIRNIDQEECEDGMNSEVDCYHGGKSYYTNWMYEYDMLPIGYAEAEPWLM